MTTHQTTTTEPTKKTSECRGRGQITGQNPETGHIGPVRCPDCQPTASDYGGGGVTRVPCDHCGKEFAVWRLGWLEGRSLRRSKRCATCDRLLAGKRIIEREALVAG